MILLIDNYDSFSYNLYQMMGALLEGQLAVRGVEAEELRVVRNDVLSVDEVRASQPSHIVLSPGPGHPRDAGICMDVVRELSDEVPILGICLGHQSICEAFGGTVGHALMLMHGKQSTVILDTSSPLFAGLPEHIDAGRYHSLSAHRDSLPDCLRITATAADGEVMAVEHRDLAVFGVQFHPESILTPQGEAILANFLAI
ncbi:MAG: aminodeoxychorismate/anthranilate synthase component II [Coriobacteriales bacterium]|nr:aminodeoxychorismate/anthranilate synthase component II [Coriobacteriales bacterium]